MTEQLNGVKAALALGGDGAPEAVHLRAEALDLRHLPAHGAEAE